jgi:DNA-binding response OmpR family regulator
MLDEAVEPTMESKPPTVLVIDDDLSYIELTTMMLKLEGYRVFTATDGRAGWKLLDKENPEVVLLDWNLPEVSGINLIKQIKEENRRTTSPYVIMVTARKEVEYRIEGMEAGADDYLVKPFDRKELLARLHVGLRTVQLQREVANQARQKTVVEMAVSISHEIANPLATAMLLQQRIGRSAVVHDTPTIREDLDLLGKQLQRIETLVRRAQSIENVVSVPYAQNITMIDWHQDTDDKQAGAA